MLHHTTIPWLPERMRRLIFSLSCSSGKAANVPKPVSFVIASSQIRIPFDARTTCICETDPGPSGSRARVNHPTRERFAWRHSGPGLATFTTVQSGADDRSSYSK